MTTTHTETERKYEVDVDAGLPDLTQLPKVVSVERVLASTLEAVYTDTADLALTAAGITLRRRTGGADAGWHLKLPQGGDDRAEIAEPLRPDEDGVPVELLDHIRGWVRDRPLRPVATLSTRRLVHRLIGDGGRILAEVSDDVVHATATLERGVPHATTWREWEIELVRGSRKLLPAAENLFVGAGATASLWPSKLHHALERLPAPAGGPDLGEANSDPTAGAVVRAYLAAQLATLLTGDGKVRSSEPDAVHKVRVATRRLRSVLSTYRTVLSRDVTDPVRQELKWFAATLGAARDAEVQLEHLLDAVAAEPSDLVLGPVADRFKVDLQADYRSAHDRLVEAINSPRYYRLLDAVEQLVSGPPFTEAASGRAKDVLHKRVRWAVRRLVAMASSSGPVAAGPGRAARDAARADRDLWLHEIRKSAKRVRYAAELAEPALGKHGRSVAAAAEEIQELLGNHQDSVVIRATLRGLAVRMHLDGDNTFTLGRLHALQQVRADESEAAFDLGWADRFAALLGGRHWR